MTANPSGVVQQEDVRAAQTALDALQEIAAESSTVEEYLLQARGHLTTWSAEVRTAGYLEGVQRGRRECSQAVLETLRLEGLAP